MTDIEVNPQRREALTLDAIVAVESIDSGEWTAQDAADAVGTVDLVRGLVMYANYLEAVVHLTRGASITEIRESARDTASAYRGPKAAAS